MPSATSFRHDPARSVLPILPGGPGGQWHWDREPIVCGHRRLTYDTARRGPVPVPVSSTPAVIGGVGVVVASDDGFVRFYRHGLTKAYWTRRLNGGVYASLLVDPARSTVVVASTTGLVVCFGLRGELVWSAEIGHPVHATPVVLPGTDVLVVAAFHGRCTGLDLRTGERRFDHELPRPWHADVGGVASYRDPYASPAATAGGTAIVCCAEHVVCLAADGTRLWQTEVGAGIKASPAVFGETAAILPVDGRCLFLDVRTGAVRREFSLGDKVIASPAVSGDILAIGGQRGDVSGVDVHTGQVRWTAPAAAPRSYTSLSTLPSGDLIATTDRGNVLCLGAEDGRFRWETSQVLGLPEHEPAMDITPVAGADGRLYCASYAGDVYEFRFQAVGEKS